MNSTDFTGIVFDQACIRFNDSFSLLDIDWRLEPGQTWAIMGASGSGKSALAASVALEEDEGDDVVVWVSANDARD